MKTQIRILWALGLLLLAGLAMVLASVGPAGASAEPGRTYAAFQRFEHGHMIWREDNGDIWVFLNDTWSTGWFSEDYFANLPDNPVPDEPPAGRIKPVNGFGRVWGHVASIRYQLGWAVEPEIGYTADFHATAPTAGGLAQTMVNLPDGTRVVMRADNSWGFSGTPRQVSSLPATTTFPAAFQSFEHGFMLYWSETGTIWVLNNQTGQALYFDSAYYGALADVTILQPTPPGYWRPILGFGKIWGHFADVRNGLGWATGPEQGYTLSFERQHSAVTVNGSAISFVVSLPDGRFVRIRDIGTWNFVAGR